MALETVRGSGIPETELEAQVRMAEGRGYLRGFEAGVEWAKNENATPEALDDPFIRGIEQRGYERGFRDGSKPLAVPTFERDFRGGAKVNPGEVIWPSVGEEGEPSKSRFPGNFFRRFLRFFSK